MTVDFSPYLTFSREKWREFRAHTPLTLSEEELVALCGFNEAVSLDEVRDIYLPLSRLLNLHVAAVQGLYQVADDFLGHPEAPKVPFVIAVAGSVAVGKSTTSRILQALLSRWPGHPNVSIVSTDNFLFSNAELDARGLMRRKGFPESYDLPSLIAFLHDLKSGRAPLSVPVYSHHAYDILKTVRQTVERSDIVILEGLNVMQVDTRKNMNSVFVSDFFDFSVFVDAKPSLIRDWYIQRFLAFYREAKDDESAYFYHFSTLTEQEAYEEAERFWDEINDINLNENVLPTRERAQLILEKGPDHSVEKVMLRKL